MPCPACPDYSAGPDYPLITKTGKVLTEAMLDEYVEEAERGYDVEAPSSWGALELTIADAMKEAEQARVDKIIGLSTVRRIADRLRGGGFVCDDANHNDPDPPPLPCNCAGPGKGCLRV